jgi:hypothetical protein
MVGGCPLSTFLLRTQQPATTTSATTLAAEPENPFQHVVGTAHLRRPRPRRFLGGHAAASFRAWSGAFARSAAAMLGVWEQDHVARGWCPLRSRCGDVVRKSLGFERGVGTACRFLQFHSQRPHRGYAPTGAAEQRPSATGNAGTVCTAGRSCMHAPVGASLVREPARGPCGHARPNVHEQRPPARWPAGQREVQGGRMKLYILKGGK